ncbi:MAG: hypothetical protein FIA94_13940 [Nitrospirae bacterium]|nr:hypothetical protein [Nitrospirota bacterium]
MTMSRTHKHHAKTRSGRACTNTSLIRDVIGSMTNFYREAAEKAQAPEVRTMFLSLAEDEQEQIEAIRAFRGRSSADIRSAGSARKMISALKKREDSLLAMVGAKTDEVEALKIAMDMEKEGIRLYGKLLRETVGPVQKDIIGRLLRKEQQRHTTFENSYIFLTDPVSWHMWNEQSFADGGTSWA